MTESLILITVILLLIVGLEVSHRRHGGAWRPGLDARNDRDLARLNDELRAVAQRDTDTAPTPPVFLAAPQSVQTDDRHVNRIAA